MKFGKRLWTAVGGCVRGANHIRNNMPCQDALRIEKTEHFYIVNVSDGHGSAGCPYSDEGAQAAVDAAYAVFTSVFAGKGDHFHTISSNKDIWLPKQIEQYWKNAILAIHKEKGREEYSQENFPYELYGATLLSLIAADNFIFALQLGDGDILSAMPVSNEVNVDWVIPPDDSLGPETNSLCQNNCWQYMKTRLIPILPNDKAPMFMLSTDGYANSFYNNDGFKQAGADFYNLLCEHGLSHIEENIESWLMESSAKGSGDDITVAIILNGD